MEVVTHVMYGDVLFVKFVESKDMYYSNTQKSYFPINAAMNCSSKNVIYLVECGCCGMQYVGETKRTFRIRANQHRRDIENENPTPVGSHFNERGMHRHFGACDINDFRIYPIIQCPYLDTEEETDNYRKQIENYLITKLKTYMPYGLNKRVVGPKDVPIIPFVAPFSTLSHKASKIAQKYYDSLQDLYPSMYTSRFVTAYSVNKNLRDFLVSSKFKPIASNF